MISKYSFYSLLSAFTNKHFFAITFQDSLCSVLKNGKNCTESFYFVFQNYQTIEQILYVWELHNDTFYIFTTSLVFSLCSRSERFHQSPFLQLHLLFLLLKTLEETYWAFRVFMPGDSGIVYDWYGTESPPKNTKRAVFFAWSLINLCHQILP